MPGGGGADTAFHTSCATSLRAPGFLSATLRPAAAAKRPIDACQVPFSTTGGEGGFVRGVFRRGKFRYGGGGVPPPSGSPKPQLPHVPLGCKPMVHLG